MSREAHIDNLDRLTVLHSQLMDEALVELENAAASIVAALPVNSGKLYDLEAAISARQELQQAMTNNFMNNAQSIVDSYDEAVGTLASLYQEVLVTGVLTATQSESIRQLKFMSFQGFEEIANAHLELMAREVYQSTLTGRAVNESVQAIRHAINGVYIQSNDDEAQALVDFISKNRDDSTKAAQVNKAIDLLHSTYSRDRLGNNLRRYANSYAHDSLMQFSASANMAIVADLEIDRWEYYGDVIKDSRDWCVEHDGQIMTTQEIRDEWASRSWKGKSSGDPFIVRGGYNCRHHFVAVVDKP